MPLKKVLLAKVELWIVAVLLSLAALAALGFGAFMKDGAERSAPRGGALGRVAFGIGATPENLFPWFFREPEPHAAEVFALALQQRFPGRSGLDVAVPSSFHASGGPGGGGASPRAKGEESGIPGCTPCRGDGRRR